MEIEKAISILLNVEIAASGTDLGGSCHIGRIALRSQQERQEGCEYCRRGIISVHMEMKPSSMGNEQLNPNRAPRFCPMCGRRLKEAQKDEK